MEYSAATEVLRRRTVEDTWKRALDPGSTSETIRRTAPQNVRKSPRAVRRPGVRRCRQELNWCPSRPERGRRRACGAGDFQQHGASLLEKLERYITSCDRIIALVGDAYGFEPEEAARPTGRPRRSAPAWLYIMTVPSRFTSISKVKNVRCTRHGKISAGATGGGVGGDQRPQASHSGQQADSGRVFRPPVSPRLFSSCGLTIQNRPTHRGMYPTAAKALGRCCCRRGALHLEPAMSILPRHARSTTL